jgi:hypothetical protein
MSTRACEEVTTTVAVLNSYVLGFYEYPARQKEVVEVVDMEPTAPTQRYQKFAALHRDGSDKLLRIIRIISRWEMTVPRFRVFQVCYECGGIRTRRSAEALLGTTPFLLPFDEDLSRSTVSNLPLRGK